MMAKQLLDEETDIAG